MSMTESEALEWFKGFYNADCEKEDFEHTICADCMFPCRHGVPILRAISALEEIQQYRAIGTVSEFRELKEKATAKEPYLFGDGYADGVPVYDEWNCPNCDTNYEVDFEHYDYCPMCGQHLDWSEGKE